MQKIKSCHVDTKIGGGNLDIFEKSGFGYSANYHGLSGLAHEKKHGRKTLLASNIDWTLDDTRRFDAFAVRTSNIKHAA